jgi:hypothetical protein
MRSAREQGAVLIVPEREIWLIHSVDANWLERKNKREEVDGRFGAMRKIVTTSLQCKQGPPLLALQAGA